ncbi:putative protein isoform X1 [Capsicum annuum]|uniref:uncharacterized protein LOC107848169 isoform X1 n=1 Tax=Capsicum annuum TaxID=4072 RepID=UPI0007BEE3D8|nr:uncharacterized protein LOC107848169 isoform X1 [Capsicum annuum]
MDDPVLNTIQIGSHMQEILYEKEGYLCTSCGRFGHVHKDCSHRQHPPPVDASSSTPSDIPNVPHPPQQKWQTVFSARRKNRTQGKSSTPDLETQSNTPIHKDTVKLMLRKMGNPVVQHNFREENIVADCLAKLGVNLNLPGTVISLRSPPLAVATHLADDVEGIVSTRNLLYVENPSVSSYVNSDAKPTSINVSGCTSATVRAFDESTPLLCTA